MGGVYPITAESVYTTIDVSRVCITMLPTTDGGMTLASTQSPRSARHWYCYIYVRPHNMNRI